jgi:Uma2 family endonuclease
MGAVGPTPIPPSPTDPEPLPMATAPGTLSPTDVPPTASPPPPTPLDEPEGLYEVIDDQILEKPPMGAYEVELASFLQGVLDTFARTNGLGRAVTEMLFRIDPDRPLDRRPDVAFVSAARWPVEQRAPRAASWEVVPDLAVEVVSPSNRTADDLRAVEDYFRAGSRLVWLVVPGIARVYVYSSPTAVSFRSLGESIDGADLLPGFSLSLAELFGDVES